MNKKTKMTSKKKAFTLVELIIVIAIIAILAVTVFLVLTKRLAKSRDSRRLSDVGVINSALQIYLTENLKLPVPSIYTGVYDTGGGFARYMGKYTNDISEQLGNISKDIKDPQGNDYGYSVTYDFKGFQVRAFTENQMSYIGNSVYAEENSSYARLVGNYGGFIVTTTGGIHALWNVPSLFTYPADSYTFGEGIQRFLQDNKSLDAEYDVKRVDITDLYDDDKNNDEAVLNKIVETFSGTNGITDTGTAIRELASTPGGIGGITIASSVGNTTKPVDGLCGSGDGESFLTQPSENLCLSGNIGSINAFSTGWTWACSGINGGIDVKCSASLKINGSCGESDGKMFVGTPSEGLCSAGTTGTVSTTTTGWTWNCNGINQGSYAVCNAKKDFTELLLHFDNNFTDSSVKNHSVTNNGVSLSSTVAEFGGYSAYFNGSSYLCLPDSDDWYIGGKDFTIDFRVRFSSFPSNNYMTLFDQGGNSFHFWLGNNRFGGNGLYLIPGIGLNEKNFASWSQNVWNHVALVRNGDLWTIYRNGVSVSSVTYSYSFPDIAASFCIGRKAYTGEGSYFNGYIDEFRFSNGIARRTANFTPPTSPYN